MKPPIRHCAIYTRKSTEEGLEQEFNNLGFNFLLYLMMGKPTEVSSQTEKNFILTAQMERSYNYSI